MIIIAGRNGDFCGSSKSVFDARYRVSETLEKFKNRKEKKQFLRTLKKDENEKKLYLWAFSLVEMLEDLNEEEKKCYKIIQKS